MRNNHKIVQELKEEEKRGRLFSPTKESSNNSSSTPPAQNNTSDQNLDHEYYKNFFENAPIYEYMVSPEETILEINKTALTNLGYKKEELLGKHLTAIYAPESHEKMKTLLPKWKETGEIDNEEMVIATKQGEKRIVLLSASSVRGADGAILYSISVLKDVTDINKIYDELNKNLWLQNVKLQKLNETKKTFLKTTSHELRTPITSIKGYVQMLMKKTLGEINEDQRKSLDVILRNTNRLDQVIQNILDASSLESGIMKFIPRKVNPRALVEEITKTMEPFAKKKEMTISVNLEKDLPDLMIDGERIKQVLMNLVDNAIKFSPDGSIINIKTRKEKEDVLFEVQDFGQGIPKDKQGMIFESFYQADSGDDRLFGGAGLSLALSKGIVGLHGGNIWFESTEGTGSTFLFTLPIQSISDMDNTELMEEMPSENTSAERVGVAVNSVTLDTTDEGASGSIAEHGKITATPKENEERYEALFNSSFELVYLHDLKGNFIDANPTALKLLGFRKEELGSLNFSSLLDGGQIWKALKALNEIKKHGRQKEPTEFRLKSKNATFIDVETTAELVYRDGKPYAIQGIARNITEQKQAKQILKESEEKYRRLFDSSPDLIIETDEKGILLAVNPAMVNHFGVPVEKLIGKNIFDILPKEVTEERAKIAKKALKDGEIKINEDENAGRRFHNVYVPIVHPDGRKTLQLVARDITAAKKAEEEIRYLKDYNLNILESNPNPIMVVKGKQIEYVNKSFVSIFGETKKEYITKNLKDVVPSEIFSVFENLLQECGISKELKFKGKDFTVISFVVKKAEEEEEEEEEEEARSGIIFQDITERKQAEETLRKKEERFNAIFNTTFQFTGLMTLDGILTEANQSAVNFTGLKLEDVINRPFWETHWWRGNEERVKKLKESIRLAASGKFIRYEVELQGSGDTTAIFDFSIKPAFGPDGKVAMLVPEGRDITERKRTEDTLRVKDWIIESTINAIAISDLQGNLTYVNPAFLKLWGYSSSAEILGKSATEFWQMGEKAAEVIDALSTRGGWIGELVAQGKNGALFKVQVSASMTVDAAGKPVCMQASFVDITERKRVEAEREKILLWQQGVNTLQHSLLAPASLENKLKTITDSIVRLFDVDFCRIWLTKPGDLCEQGCIHAEVHEGPHVCRYRDRCLHLLASSGRYTHTDGKIHRRVPFGCYKIGRVASGEDHRFLINDVQNDPRVHNNEWARELGLVSFAGYQLKIPGGETIGVLALFAKHPILSAEDTMLDGLGSNAARIVQQAIAEEALQESEERHRVLFESSRDATMTLEPPTWNFTTGNPATIELFKAKNEEEFTSKGPGNLSPERQPDGRASAEKAKEMIETAMRDGSCFFEWTHKRMNGEDFSATVLLSRIAQGGKVFLQATVRDITMQKKLEIKLKEKIDDLELFKKLTVGRELKMVELKMEIEELNKKLKEEK